MNIDKNNWCINIDKEGLTESQLKVVYKFLSDNYAEGPYSWIDFRNFVVYSLEKKGLYNWDLIGVINGEWASDCSDGIEYLNVPTISYDEFKNYILKNVDEVNKEHQYEPLVSEGLASFCTDTESVVNIISEEEVWIKWRGLQWNIVGWSDKKFNKLVKKIKWLEESSSDEEGY